jgi:hypothetical protein
MVCDGCRSDPDTYRVHLKNWWGNMNEDAWYDLSQIPGQEGAITNIYPAPSLGSFITGDYAVPSFPYRYFDQDASGLLATFAPGHNLQFLPGVKVTGLAAPGVQIIGPYVRFTGQPSANTRLFSIKGTATGGLVAGIQIHDGGIRLYKNGSLRFH